MTGSTARKRGRRGSPESWSVDAHVGQRVRMRRTLLGMSQEKLGEAIGLTFQQVQKYERGSNRISAGTLYRLGQVLDVPVSFFFDCYEDPDSPNRSLARDDNAPLSDSQISRREARLLRLWRAAPSHVSDELLSLLSSLSPGLREAQDGGEPIAPGFAEASAPSPRPVAPPPDGTTPAKTDGARRYAHIDTPPRLRSNGDEGGAGVAKATKMDRNKPRRRHGAVWDPADIVRASKTQNRE